MKFLQRFVSTACFGWSVCVLLAFVTSLALAAESAKLAFDIPSGDAFATLKQFSAQSDARLLYSVDAVKGVTTNAVKGTLTAREALNRLVTNTVLIVTENSADGALAVTRGSDERSKADRVAPPTPNDRPIKNPAQELDEAVQLNAFEVQASTDTSYGALNSNSITRFNTELATMPVSADIFTKAFMDDVAASSVEAMIQEYSAGAGFSTSDPGGNAAQVQPGDLVGTSYIQLRGLSTPLSQRDGFMPVGSYNAPGSTGVGMTSNFDVERVEVIRGPQALLYGAGGAGGVINITSKMAHFKRRNGSALFRVNQYGQKQAELDLNYGDKKFAVRAAFLRQEQQGRRLNIGGRINGQYLQFAASLFGNTTVRLSLEQTKFARIANSNFNVNLRTNDPRNGYSLQYLLATNQAGETDPVTGAAYSSGSLLNGKLDWNNVNSLAGKLSSDLTVTDFVQLTADTKWSRWLSTQFAVGYNNYWNQVTNGGLNLRGPGANGNALPSWSMSGLFSDLTLPAISKGVRFSALATHDLFRGAGKSQTIVGADFWRTALSEIGYRSFLADGNFNAVVNPAIAANNGRTIMPAQFWSLADGVVLNPLGEPFGQTSTVNGVNYVRQLTSPPNPALRTADNPLGIQLGGGSYVVSRLVNRGLFGANTTSWLDNRLNTLAGFRFAYSDYNRYDQQAPVNHKQAISDTVNFNLGANYALLSWLRPYIGISDSNQPPAVVALGPTGEVPKPAHGLGAEVGLKFANRSGTFSGSIAAYGVDSKNEEFRITSPLQVDINPVGLNGRGPSGVWVNVDRQSKGLEFMLTAAPTSNWRMRLSASTVDGTINSTRIYPQLYNDQFYAKDGAVTYADGSPVWVPTTPSAVTPTRPAGTAGAVPLTIALMNTPTSPYWANPQAITAAITTSSAVATVLRSTDPVHGPILTGVAGLPISALQIAPNPASPPPVNIPVSLSGEKTVGYPLYSASFTNLYDVSAGPLRGFKIGGTTRLGWKYRNYYYYPSGIVPGISRSLFSYPTQVQFDLITGYTRKLGRYVFSTQLNVANLFNRYHVLILPNANSGYQTPTLLNATFDNQPRVFTWTNEIKF